MSLLDNIGWTPGVSQNLLTGGPGGLAFNPVPALNPGALTGNPVNLGLSTDVLDFLANLMTGIPAEGFDGSGIAGYPTAGDLNGQEFQALIEQWAPVIQAALQQEGINQANGLDGQGPVNNGAAVQGANQQPAVEGPAKATIENGELVLSADQQRAFNNADTEAGKIEVIRQAFIEATGKTDPREILNAALGLNGEDEEIEDGEVKERSSQEYFDYIVKKTAADMDNTGVVADPPPFVLKDDDD